MGVLCPSLCFCNTDGRSERIKASILSGMRPHMAAISVSHSSGVLAGTGFLIDRNLLVTTHAILPSSSTAMNANIRLHGAVSAHLCPQRFFITSSILDLTVVYLETTPIAKSDWLHCSKAVLKSSLNFGSKVYFLGHQSRELIVGEGKVVIATDNLVKLSTDCAPWSAGSAGFDLHGHLSFMICDPMKLATSSNTSSSSSSKDELTQFGIPIVIIRDWLNSHWSGDLTRLRLMSLDHSSASFPLGRARQEEAERSSLIERRAENDEPVRFLNINIPQMERNMDESDDDCSPSLADVSSTGSVNGGIGCNEIECSPSVSAVRNWWSSEEETMYSAETAESRNYSTPPKNSKFPPVSCSTFSKMSLGIRSRGSGGVLVDKHVKKGNSSGGAPQKYNDYFTPTVSSVMKKKNGSNQGGQPRWVP